MQPDTGQTRRLVAARYSPGQQFTSAAAAAILISVILVVTVVVQGCSFGGDQRFGEADTVNLNQLWGLVAQAKGLYPDRAVLAAFEMTVAPSEDAPSGASRVARVESLHLSASAGPIVDVAAVWPADGPGELSIKAHKTGSDPGPPTVGYSLARVFSNLDYVGPTVLRDELQRHTGEETIRLRLVYPPPRRPYGEEWGVPFLALRGRSVAATTSTETSTSGGSWASERSPAVFQVLSASNDTLLAILVVPDD